MKDEVILEMKGISKSFAAVKAVSDGYLTLRRGEVHALMGENGAGKSTLMNILSGALRADSGNILFYGQEAGIGSPIQARNLGIGKIHQELQLVPELTVGENIFLGREPRTKLGFVDYKKMYRDARQLLHTLGLDISPEVQTKNLRVGEQQLVEIAKVTSLNAKVMIMDEPTSALSKQETGRLFEIIRQLQQTGVGIIYITHRMEEVYEISDRITVMRDGAYISTLNTCETNKDELIRLMVGREVKADRQGTNHTRRECIMRVENLNLNLPVDAKKTSLHDISFSLQKGEVLGLAGLMGAGRTELLECLFGLHPHHVTGHVYIDGQLSDAQNPEEAIASKLVFLTENRKEQGLVLSMSIGQNMTLPVLRRLSPHFFVNTGQEQPLCRKQIEDISIKAPSANTPVSNLSGGNQQKVLIGRWLLTQPDILLLDEPTRGIDVGARGEIYNLISDMAAQGKGILVVSSELPELLSICDRILTICEGRLTGEFMREEADQEILLRAATLREGEKHAVGNAV